MYTGGGGGGIEEVYTGVESTEEDLSQGEG